MKQNRPPESDLEQTVEMLYHDDPPMRARAILKLAQLGEAAVPHLVEALGHDDLDVRLRAAQTLVEMKDERGTVALLDLVRDMEHPDIDSAVRERYQYFAESVLMKTVDERAVEHLIAALDDPEASVRSTAARLLGKIGDVRAVDPLIINLDDDDPGVHLAAVGALGDIGDKRAVAPLINALPHAELREDQRRDQQREWLKSHDYIYADFYKTVSDIILEALRQIGTPRARLVAMSWTPTQTEEINKALKQIGRKVLAAVQGWHRRR